MCPYIDIHLYNSLQAKYRTHVSVSVLNSPDEQSTTAGEERSDCSSTTTRLNQAWDSFVMKLHHIVQIVFMQSAG